MIYLILNLIDFTYYLIISTYNTILNNKENMPKKFLGY